MTSPLSGQGDDPIMRQLDAEASLAEQYETGQGGPEQGNPAEKEYPLSSARLAICSACLDGIGSECHTPGCAFWMSSVPDVPLRAKVDEGVLPVPASDDYKPGDPRVFGRHELAAVIGNRDFDALLQHVQGLEEMIRERQPVPPVPAEECLSCGEETPRGECPESKRDCGHHCNHSWSQDACCWCGQTFGAVDDSPVPARRTEEIARRFHEAYERLAPEFGYETRAESAVPWAEVPETNRRLMCAVVEEVLVPARREPAAETQEVEATDTLLRHFREWRGADPDPRHVGEEMLVALKWGDLLADALVRGQEAREHRHGYSCEQAEREIDAQMSSRLEAQECLRLICGAIDLSLDQLAEGWKASLPIILARLETIVNEAERAFRERDAAEARVELLEAQVEAADKVIELAAFFRDSALDLLLPEQLDALILPLAQFDGARSGWRKRKALSPHRGSQEPPQEETG